MHQAASLDLVSMNVLIELEFTFSLQGLDVRFFVLRRSALSTIGDKKRLSAVNSGHKRELPAIFDFSHVVIWWDMSRNNCKIV